MKKGFLLLMLVVFVSCRSNQKTPDSEIITVSIAPFSYFVTEIAGDDFVVNVMVQPGSNPHIYEPYPDQIARLLKSRAYVSNGYLGFEKAWLSKFYEINSTMRRLSLGDNIDPIASEHDHEGEHAEGADPHYWVSPACAMKMAASVRDLLVTLNPDRKENYESGYLRLTGKIKTADSLASALLSKAEGRSFMIYHPNLAYLARDYGLKEVAVEFEGKEPPPSWMKELIDLAREEKINTIFVQREYDTKNALAIAGEIGADITVIDPLSVDWLAATVRIINELYESFNIE